jgi:hypothetical protein
MPNWQISFGIQSRRVSPTRADKMSSRAMSSASSNRHLTVPVFSCSKRERGWEGPPFPHGSWGLVRKDEGLVLMVDYPALSTPAIALRASTIGVMQWRTAHQRAVLDLFDKRWGEAFNELRSIISEVLQEGPVTTQNIFSYAVAVPATFPSF